MILAATAACIPIPAPYHTLALSSEFDGAAGSALPGWNIAPGPGWTPDGFTYSPGNVRVDGHGNLVLTVNRTGTGAATRYTGANIWTQVTYPNGRIEARIMTPANAVGAGIWPAFWAFSPGEKIAEVDIMEGGPGCINCWQVMHGTTTTGAHWMALNKRPALTGWHTYSFDWNASIATWRVDGQVTYQITRTSLTGGKTWPYAGPFTVVLDILPSGWSGPPNAATRYPATMTIDYVRIFR
jgi:beta-glucanase (GH16 family)